MIRTMKWLLCLCAFVACGGSTATNGLENRTGNESLEDSSITSNVAFISFSFQYTGAPDAYRLFIDDGRPETPNGYTVGGMNADYLLENGNLYKFSGNDNSQWAWTRIGSDRFWASAGAAHFQVARALIGETDPCTETGSVVFQTVKSDRSVLEATSRIPYILTPDRGCPIPLRFRPLAQAVAQELASSGAPGAAIAVVENGRVSFARGFGTKTPGENDPVMPTTLFHIGSITKMLTAIALLQRVQAGQVDLDKPLVDYVPGFHLTKTPSRAQQVTVRELLNHTSSIFDYLEIDAPPDERTDDALERFFTGRYADIGYVQTPPGTFYSYSNPDYMLAGLIAQKAAGTSYRQLMHENVFEPLGMYRTVFLPSEVLSDGDYANGLVTSTTPIDGWPVGLVRPDSYDNPWARPAGYAWSSVLDMAHLAAFLVHGRNDVLAKDLWAAMTSPQATIVESARTASYGFGTVIQQGISLSSGYYPLKSVWHNGGIPGYSSNLFCIPDRDFCFITLVNGVADIAESDFPHSKDVAIRTLVDLPAPTTPPDVSPRLDRYAAYAGVYVDPFGVGRVEVTAVGGKLFIKSEWLDAMNIPYDPELKPTILDDFALELQGGATSLPVAFIADSAGRYTYLYSQPYIATRDETQK